MKRILLLFLLCWSLVLPAFSGVYEDALSKNDKVFLYFYIPDCKTCKAFDRIYDSLQAKNKDFGYVRVDANTLYGSRLIWKMRGRYVPYIILADSKTKKTVNISHTCVMDEVCMQRAMKSFKG